MRGNKKMDMDTIASLLMAGGLASIFLLGSLVGWYAHILHQQDRDMQQCDKEQRAWHAEHRPGVPYDDEEFSRKAFSILEKNDEANELDVSPEDMARIRQHVLDGMFGTEQQKHDERARKLLRQLDNDSGQGAGI